MEMNESVVEIRKILVKCPPAFEDAFNAFPFLIALSEEFPRAEINLLCEENGSLAFHFLPFKVRAFERPKEKMSLVQTHHFCANLHDIFNIDLFFDLENTFNSSFMGFNFRARERVGFGVGWNKYFLTKNFLALENVSVEKKCVKLLEQYIGKTIPNLKISRVRTEGLPVEKVEQLFKEPEPPKFMLLMLDSFQNVAKQVDLWKRFFDSFENQKFIIWTQNDEEPISELFSSIDLGENNLYMHKGSNVKEMIYLLDKVQGVITNNVWSEALCNYFGVSAISLLKNISTSLPEYFYFAFKPQRFVIPDEGAILYSYEEESREILEFNQVIDHIHFQFKL